MASKILKGRFQNLFDTASNWTTSNPTLMDGEIAVVKTNDGKIKFKIGRDSKKFSEIAFFGEDLENSLSLKSQVQICKWEATD